jgi:hypothetical protein
MMSNIQIFWNGAPCRHVNSWQHIAGSLWIHLLGQAVSPGTAAAEQMPKCYTVDGDAVSVEHVAAGINQNNTHFTATVMWLFSTACINTSKANIYLTYVFHLGYTHMCISSLFPTLLCGIISWNLSLQNQTVHHNQQTGLHNLQTPNSAPSKCKIRHKSWF